MTPSDIMVRDTDILMAAVMDKVSTPSPFFTTPEADKIHQVFHERYMKLVLSSKQKYRKRPIEPLPLP